MHNERLGLNDNLLKYSNVNHFYLLLKHFFFFNLLELRNTVDYVFTS